ncbi:MAG: AmmeMemoRadiSam system protein B [Candidatus Hydrogenedentota bacterium]
MEMENAIVTRKPAVAGQFYPGDPGRLRSVVRKCLQQADVEPAPEQAAALIAPHAGYPFSGPSAAYAYKRVEGKRPERVILVGCSHRYAIEKASVFGRGVFDTPVGAFPIDEAFASEVIHLTGNGPAEPHRLEHSLEVQLPFLEAVIGVVPIVPILFGAPPSQWHAEFGQRLAGMVDKDDLLVISTDLSHFLNEEDANAIDRRSVQAVLEQDWQAFSEGVAAGRYSMCGATAVVAGMAYAQALDARQWRWLDYRTSAQATGDRTRVVGYAALTMEY